VCGAVGCVSDRASAWLEGTDGAGQPGVPGLDGERWTQVSGWVVASRDWSTGLYIGMSMLVHTGLLAAMAFFMPPLGLTDDEGVSKDQLFLIQQYLNAAAERELEQKETEQVTEGQGRHKEGGTGTRAKGEEARWATRIRATPTSDTVLPVRRTIRTRTSLGRRLFAKRLNSA